MSLELELTIYKKTANELYEENKKLKEQLAKKEAGKEVFVTEKIRKPRKQKVLIDDSIGN